MVSQTSVDSYFEAHQRGLPDTQHDMMLILLRYAEEPLSDKDMSRALGIAASTISARRNELLEKGLLKKAGTKKDPFTRMRVKAWEVAP